MGTSSKEKTLCAWCDKAIGETEKVRYNGEFICRECKTLNTRIKKSTYRFWKGVKNV